MGYSFSNIQIKNKGKALDTDRALEVLTAGKNLRKAEIEEEADIISPFIRAKKTARRRWSPTCLIRTIRL